MQKNRQFPVRVTRFGYFKFFRLHPTELSISIQKRCIISTRNSVFHLIKETIKQIAFLGQT